MYVLSYLTPAIQRNLIELRFYDMFFEDIRRIAELIIFYLVRSTAVHSDYKMMLREEKGKKRL